MDDYSPCPCRRYLMARVTKRRLIYHAGPTNSGKTHHALQAFLKAETAVYCSPLRMLANEICHRANKEVSLGTTNLELFRKIPW